MMTETPAETPIRRETFACDGPAEIVVAAHVARIEIRLADVQHVRVEISEERAEAPGWERGFEGLLDKISRGKYDPDEASAHFVAETRVTFSEQRRRLVVRAPRTLRRSRLAIVIEAPERSKATTRTHWGSLAVSGTLTGLDAGTGFGEVTADRIDGNVNARAGKGDIRLGRVAGRLRAQNGSGELEVASIEGQGARLASGQGDVWLGVVRADVHARAGSGDLAVAEAGSGRIDLVAGSGDVTVAIRPGVAAELDLQSGSGRARSELDVSDQRPANAPLLMIRARSGSGDVLVQPVASG